MTPSSHEYADTSECSDILSLSLSLKKENISSYGGIYSNLKDEHSLTDFSENNSHKNKEKNTNTQNVTFQWDEEELESDIVYLTGNFCNWKQFFIMPKIDKKYIITLPLPKALHKFKFRINEIYKINKNYPVMKDGENNCNYIDTSVSKSINSSEIKEEKNLSEEEDSNSSSSSSSDSSLNYEAECEDHEERIKRYKKRKMKKKKYSRKFPKKNDLNNNSPDVPYSYNYMLNINIISSQKLIGNKKYYEPKENNVLGDNCSYKKIGVLPAVEINHLHSNNLIIAGDRALCSSFVRYRNKFITILYYKPM